MAKTLQERIASAKGSSRVRTADLGQLIDDTAKEIELLSSQHSQLSADSINFALAELDRDNAATQCEKVGRSIKGLSVELAALRTLLEEREASDQAASLKAEQDAAVAERDALAEKIPGVYGEATASLIALANEILASDARLRACGLGGSPSAEAIARKCSGDARGELFMGSGGMHMARLTKIRLPALDSHEAIWPQKDPGAHMGIAFTALAGPEMLARARERLTL